MRLSRLDLKNFRLLREASIRCDRKVLAAILVGPNNTGKTSVAEALQLFTKGTGKRFSIFDFSLACREAFDKVQQFLLGTDVEPQEDTTLPTISMALHFDYDDVAADLAVAGDLLMDLDPQSYKIAVLIEFAINDIDRLTEDYRSDREQDESLFDFLSTRLHDYYAISCFKMAPDTGERERLPDASALERLIRVDFVAAQRHIDDQENSRATRLSGLLHAHYGRHYKEAEPEGYKALESALRTHSTDLSSRYMNAFARLIEGLLKFGYPRIPRLSIKAELSASTLFKDNTRVYYASDVEAQAGGETTVTYNLPEKYNGLGFKNLIYMILQLMSFREELEEAEVAKPRVHLIVIEEPEVHLHPQMQNVFLRQISGFLDPEGSEGEVQLMITTHSSHIVAVCGFSPVRYFRRRGNTAEVKDLLEFESSHSNGEEANAVKFLARYLTLTRCDLFFSDKAILIEGQVERLLLMKMIEKCATGPQANLASDYISIVEVGGAYAHRFKSLVKFIEIPTLIITDLDSIGEDRKRCRVTEGHSSSNATLKTWLPAKTALAELRTASRADKTDGSVQVAYQVPDEDHLPCGRSFEEAFIYQNAEWLFANRAQFIGTPEILAAGSAADLREIAYELTMNKVDFALDLMLADGWRTPKYIADGLAWLAERSAQ